MQQFKGHNGMNDYFLGILAEQRNETILTEVRANQFSQKKYDRTKCGYGAIRLFRYIFSRWKKAVAFEPAGLVERSTS